MGGRNGVNAKVYSVRKSKPAVAVFEDEGSYESRMRTAFRSCEGKKLDSPLESLEKNTAQPTPGFLAH